MCFGVKLADVLTIFKLSNMFPNNESLLPFVPSLHLKIYILEKAQAHIVYSVKGERYGVTYYPSI